MQFFRELKTWRMNYGFENTLKRKRLRFFKVYSPLKEPSHKQQTPRPTVFFTSRAAAWSSGTKVNDR